MRAVLSRRLPQLLIVLGALGTLAAVPLLLVSVIPLLTWFYALAFVIAFGAGIAAFRAHPENRAARLLLAFGALAIFWNTTNLALVYAFFSGYAESPWLVAGNTLALMLDAAIGTLPLAILAVYPDGRYQRPYERHVTNAALALVVSVPLLLLLAGDQIQPSLIFSWVQVEVQTANPLALGALDWLRAPLAGYAESALTIPALVAAPIALARYRRFTPERRAQMAWPFAGAILFALSSLNDPLYALRLLPTALQDGFEVMVLVVAPALFTIGIVRPTLFDMQLVLRRSLLFGGLWAVIALMYLGVAAVIGVAARPGGVQASVVVAIAATLLIQPVWRRAVGRASRSVYGERPGSEELLRRIGSALEHTLDLDGLAGSVAATVREGLGVRWVRIELEGSTVASDGALPEPGAAPACSAELHDGGQRLGRIECGPRPGGRLGRADRELLGTLGRQAALAIRNARLARELAGRLEEIGSQASELAASRTRIVEAQEQGRRQIERDIHDGVQQELVALIARIGLARTQLGRDPAMLDATLKDLQWEARQALADLRELAGGIHPSVLSDRGIVEAIESRSSRLPLGVTIECDRALRGERYPQSVEGAAYFVVCEAFANALKHSGAERVVVRLAHEHEQLSVEVADNGHGFDGDRGVGSGLDGLADRIAALGGTFAVTSEPDAGTTIVARLPVHDYSPA